MNEKLLKFPILAICSILFLFGAAVAQAAANPCSEELLRKVPPRAPAALEGSEFARRVQTMSEHDREAAIETELLAGNIPAFLRRVVPVSLGGDSGNGQPPPATICVLPDYLAIGSDRDFLLVPMRLATAINIAGHYGFTLPTTKMVDAIYEQSVVHLAPQPLPAGEQMRSTDYYWHHTEIIRRQEATLGEMPGRLTAGDKKDLVITNLLWRNLARIAIYGWHRSDHNPIQPLATVHGARYADYSHGVRLVSSTIFVGGEARSIFDALGDAQLARLLSGEGPIQRVRQLLLILAAPPAEAAANASSVSGSALPAIRTTASVE